LNLKLKDIVGNIFYTDEKEQAAEQQKASDLQQKVNNAYGTAENPTNNSLNPFLKNNGELFNPNLNYQQLLDNPNISQKAKNYITQATGLTPKENTPSVNVSKQDNSSAVSSDNANSESLQPASGGNYSNSVGKKIANTSGYNNSAAKGQCVWYVRGRMSEKLGKDTGAIGNANEMWYNAKPEAKLSASADNIKPDTIASYKYGSGGNEYGHVIYIEDVVGDTVYYTEGGTHYTNNGTTGVLKTASKSDIMNGGSVGKGLIGFIDLSQY
jgi:surface antigen